MKKMLMFAAISVLVLAAPAGGAGIVLRGASRAWDEVAQLVLKTSEREMPGDAVMTAEKAIGKRVVAGGCVVAGKARCRGDSFLSRLQKAACCPGENAGPLVGKASKNVTAGQIVAGGVAVATIVGTCRMTAPAAAEADVQREQNRVAMDVVQKSSMKEQVDFARTKVRQTGDAQQGFWLAVRYAVVTLVSCLGLACLAFVTLKAIRRNSDEARRNRNCTQTAIQRNPTDSRMCVECVP